MFRLVATQSLAPQRLARFVIGSELPSFFAKRVRVASFGSAAAFARAAEAAAGSNTASNMSGDAPWMGAAPERDACWSCGSGVAQSASLTCGSCGSVLPLPDKEPDLFAVLGLPRTYKVDTGRLETAFKKAQRAMHPDRFAAAAGPEETYASQASALCNKAVGVLRDPIERAMYLLASSGYDLEEMTLADEPELLMEVLEAQEEVAEATDLDLLHQLQAQAEARCASTEAAFAALIDGPSDNLPAAQRKAIEMKYWNNIREAANDHIARLEKRSYSDRV
ncbi:DnaJ-domain-containing protein 1 [Thecamonas trahens ATCC 50062]|uniref:DnaJ-domain-containing protein 1 n=1 Tax=Thecamonas trahens ATCC 50062 TaxID=461836 RepID=A0A0L0DW12_THETB|nr:DnaJ-domain-containing protein 1 [Thecamonas trahens ATCC 50062]KNC56362.1 DnaJ-domain-containing protein 1 [Thecamonas trahens ATCC 50062]|eukprot:XP_013760877.1 DnaJ-domain-containing protein 1 [Thecamonas trahens ATCC 50062]